ncbi:MAG: helix-turn-helix domain-containing protein [Acidimicrobiales bacterium]
MQSDELTGVTRDQGPSLLLTMVETASMLRLGRTQTYELVMRGSIPSVTIGRRRLVLRTGLEEFIHDLVAEQESTQAQS